MIIYLMNNYISDKKKKNLVVYAQGFNRKQIRMFLKIVTMQLVAMILQPISLPLEQLYRIAEGGNIDISIDET